MHTETSVTKISIAVILSSNETSKTNMIKTVVMLSEWFVLLFIVRDIPSWNVVLHMCFPTNSVSHCSVPPSRAICCAVSNVWRIWETRPWQCARSVRLWDMAMQKGKWLGSYPPPTQDGPHHQHAITFLVIGNPNQKTFDCRERFQTLVGRKSWMSMRWAKRWLPSAPFVDEVFFEHFPQQTGGFKGDFCS